MGRCAAGFVGTNVAGARKLFRLVLWIESRVLLRGAIWIILWKLALWKFARIFFGRIISTQEFRKRVFVAGIVGASQFLLAFVESESSEDEGSALREVARRRSFRRTFLGRTFFRRRTWRQEIASGMNWRKLSSDLHLKIGREIF